jgi:hypothetical protein
VGGRRGKIPPWCKEHGVSPVTGRRWYRDESVRRLIEEYRNRVVDRAIGQMARGLGKAVKKMIELIEKGRTDAVKLGAAKALIEKLIDVQNHAELRAELKRLDQRLESQEQRRRARKFEAPETGSPGSRLSPAEGKPKESRDMTNINDSQGRAARAAARSPPDRRPSGPTGSIRPGPLGRADGR